jgi:uncharacterized membrane protein YkvA (DUF1232 family)
MGQTQMDRTDRQERSDRDSDREREQVGWLREFLRHFELAWQLLWDNRVPLSTKLVPLLAALYVVSPFDLIPDALLGIGQVDDLVLVLLGMRMFISLCPPEIVSEYTRFSPPGRERQGGADVQDPDIIELEPRVPPDNWESATLRPNPRQSDAIAKNPNKDR